MERRAVLRLTGLAAAAMLAPACAIVDRLRSAQPKREAVVGNENEPPPGITQSWGRIVAWLRANAPVTHSQLLDGASEKSLRELESVVGPVPDELKEWLRLSNGSHWRTDGFMPWMYRTLSCTEIAKQWRMLEETHATPYDKEEFARALAAPAGTEGGDWLPHFLPIMADNTIVTVVIDRRPGKLHGCLTSFDPESPETSAEWTSLATMLRDAADSMERRRTNDDWRAVVEDGELSWEPTN